MKEIGKGVSGVVVLKKAGFSIKAPGEPRKQIALKMYHNRFNYESRPDFIARVRHEYQLLVSLHHPNIVRVYKFKESKIAMEMEYCPQKFREYHDCLALFPQLVDLVLFLHSCNILHRDLKLDNLMVSNGVLKVIDFQDSKRVPSSGLVRGIVGTQQYVAPEVYTKIEYHAFHSEMWNLGILLYWCLYGRFPWLIADIYKDENFMAFTKFGFDLERLGKVVKATNSASKHNFSPSTHTFTALSGALSPTTLPTHSTLPSSTSQPNTTLSTTTTTTTTLSSPLGTTNPLEALTHLLTIHPSDRWTLHQLMLWVKKNA